jgi:hypothetical protein
MFESSRISLFSGIHLVMHSDLESYYFSFSSIFLVLSLKFLYSFSCYVEVLSFYPVREHANNP